MSAWPLNDSLNALGRLPHLGRLTEGQISFDSVNVSIVDQNGLAQLAFPFRVLCRKQMTAG
jgi:hypothetical protein